LALLKYSIIFSVFFCYFRLQVFSRFLDLSSEKAPKQAKLINRV